MSLSRNHDDPDEASLSNRSWGHHEDASADSVVAKSLRPTVLCDGAHGLHGQPVQAHAVAATIPRKEVPVSCSPDVGQLAASCESPCLGDGEL